MWKVTSDCCCFTLIQELFRFSVCVRSQILPVTFAGNCRTLSWGETSCIGLTALHHNQPSSWDRVGVYFRSFTRHSVRKRSCFADGSLWLHLQECSVSRMWDCCASVLCWIIHHILIMEEMHGRKAAGWPALSIWWGSKPNLINVICPDPNVLLLLSVFLFKMSWWHKEKMMSRKAMLSF